MNGACQLLLIQEFDQVIWNWIYTVSLFYQKLGPLWPTEIH